MMFKAGLLQSSVATMKADFENFYNSLSNNTSVYLLLVAGSLRLIIGFKRDNLFGAFKYIQYGSGDTPISGNFLNITGGNLYWCV